MKCCIFGVILTVGVLSTSLADAKKPSSLEIRTAAITTGCYNGYRDICGCYLGTQREGSWCGHQASCPTPVMDSALNQWCMHDTYMRRRANKLLTKDIVALSISSCKRYLTAYYIVVLDYRKTRAEARAKLACELRVPIWYSRETLKP